MSIADQLAALAASKAAIRAAIIDRGVAMPPGAPFADYPNYIAMIEGVGTPIDVFLFLSDSEGEVIAANDPQNLSGFTSDAGMLCWNGEAAYGGAGLTQYVPNVNAAYTPAAGKTRVHGLLPGGEWGRDTLFLQRYRDAHPGKTVAVFVSNNGGSTAAYYPADQGGAFSWDVARSGDRWAFFLDQYAKFCAALVGAGYNPKVRMVSFQFGQNDAAKSAADTLFYPAITAQLAAAKALPYAASNLKVFHGKPIGNGGKLASVRDDIYALAIKQPQVSWIDTSAYPVANSHWTAAGMISYGHDLYSAYVTAEAEDDKVQRTLGTRLLRWWNPDNGVTITGQGVGAWADIVADQAPSQAIDTGRPQYAPAGFAGGPGLATDGTADQLNLADPAGLPTGATPHWGWAVVQDDAPGSDTSSRTVYNYRAAGADAGGRKMLTRGIAGVRRAEVRTGTGAAFAFVTDNTTDMSGGKHVVCAKHGATVSAIRVDAHAEVTAAAIPATDAPTNLTLLSAGGAQFWQGSNADIMFTAPLSASLEAAMFSYLGRQAGLVL